MPTFQQQPDGSVMVGTANPIAATSQPQAWWESPQVKAIQAENAGKYGTRQDASYLQQYSGYKPGGTIADFQVGIPTGGTPQATVQQTLSPTEQAKLDKNNALSLNLLDTAQKGLGRVDQMMGTPFDMSGLTQISPIAQGGSAAFNTNGMQGFSGINTGSLSPQGQFNIGGAPQTQALNRDGMQGMSSIDTSGLGSGSIDMNALGQRGNLTTDGLQGFSGIDPSALSPQGQQIDLSQLNQRSVAPSVGGMDQVYKSIVDRQSPEFARQRQQLENDLKVRGFTPGSEAFNAEADRISRQQNDFSLAAMAQAGQEQQRIFNMESQARSQGLNEQSVASQMAQQLRAQGMNEQQVQAQVNAAIRGQQFGEQNTIANFNQARRGQDYSEQMGNAQLQEQMRAQRVNEQAMQSDALRANRQQDFSERQGINQSQMQQRQQYIAEQAMQADYANQLRQMGLNEQQVQAQVNNAIRSQQFGERGALAQFDQSEQQRQFQNSLAQNQATAQQRQQQIQEQAYLRQLPLNEINALRTGSQANLPQFQAYQGAQVQAAPLFDASVAKGNFDLANYQNQPDTMGGLFSLGGSILGGMATGGTGLFAPAVAKAVAGG